MEKNLIPVSKKGKKIILFNSENNLAFWRLQVDCDGRVKVIGGIPFSEKKNQLNEIYEEFTASYLFSSRFL